MCPPRPLPSPIGASARETTAGRANRLLLADRMQQAIAQAKRNGKRLAVGYLDLDGFKPVNDQYGHDAGDALLIEIARRLEKAVREMDTVARLGGDEFVVLLLELAQVQECEVILNRILKSLRQPIRLGPETVTVGVSIGVCLYPGSGSDDPDGLLRYADRLCTGPSRPARIAIASGIPRFQRVRHERSAFRSGCRHLPAQCRRSAAVYCGQPE